MTASVPLPELHEGLLDEQEVQALFHELQRRARVLAVLPKRAARACADGSSLELGSALEALLAGELHGVQLRYLHAGQEWWDTLLRAGGGFRLVRLAQPPATGAGSCR